MTYHSIGVLRIGSLDKAEEVVDNLFSNNFLRIFIISWYPSFALRIHDAIGIYDVKVDLCFMMMNHNLLCIRYALYGLVLIGY